VSPASIEMGSCTHHGRATTATYTWRSEQGLPLTTQFDDLGGSTGVLDERQLIQHIERLGRYTQY
jgi:hypothetical protein